MPGRGGSRGGGPGLGITGPERGAPGSRGLSLGAVG